MNLESLRMKEVIMATLDNPCAVPDFTKAERPNPEHWARLTSVLTCVQVPYDLTKLFGAHKYVTVRDVLTVSKKLASHNHQVVLVCNCDMVIWQAANA